MNKLSHVSLALLVLGAAASASAQTVVLDTYAPGNNADGWPSLVYRDGTARQDIAIPFTLSSATSIQSILTSLDGFGGVTLGIVASQGGLPQAGGSWLYSTHLTDPSFNTLVSPSGWNLAAGTYWLAAVGDNGFDGTWQSGTDENSGVWAQRTSDGGAWSAVDSNFIGMPAARITVTSAVPEPSTYALMLAGAGLLLVAARRKQGGQA